MMLILMQFSIKYEEENVRTTVTLDDDLYAKALEVADPDMNKADLFREAVELFVRIQAAKRLAALGGSAPKIKSAPRRKASRS